MQGFFNLLLKFILRHGAKRDHDKAFKFLGDLVAGTFCLGFGHGSTDDISFLPQELFNVNCVILEDKI